MNALPLDIRVDGGRADNPGWPLDRGLHYGDGLFETMVVRGGRLRFAALHRARLAQGLARLRIALDEEATWREVGSLATERTEALLKLLVTRGDATERGHHPDDRSHPAMLPQPPLALLCQVTIGCDGKELRGRIVEWRSNRDMPTRLLNFRADTLKLTVQ